MADETWRELEHKSKAGNDFERMFYMTGTTDMCDNLLTLNLSQKQD